MLRRRTNYLTPLEPLNSTQELIRDDIEFNIKFGSDKKKQSDSVDSSHESAKKTEHFLNEDYVALSPTNSPVPQPNRIEHAELEQEMSTKHVTRTNSFRHFCVLLSCLSVVYNTISFIRCALGSGGLYFLIPYVFTNFLFGTSISIFYMALSQYTSLPMFSIFERIAPILGGIPHLIFITRIFYTVIYAFDPRFFIYIVKCLITIVLNDRSWLNCEKYPSYNCYDPALQCKTGHFQRNGECHELHSMDVVADHHPVAILSYMTIKDPLIRMTSSQIYGYLKSFDLCSYLIATIVALCIAGFVAYRGYQFFSSLAPFFCFAPLIGVIPFSIMAAYDMTYSVNELGRLQEEMHNMTSSLNGGEEKFGFSQFNVASKAFTVDAFLNACRLVAKNVFVGDGTLYTIGYMADFRHNFVRDALLLPLVGGLYRIVLALVVVPVFFINNRLAATFVNVFRVDEEAEYPHVLNTLFTSLPSLNIDGVSNTALFTVLALFYFSVNCAFIPIQVITFEMAINWSYHVFPQLLYLPHKFVRFSVITASSCVMIFLFYIKYTLDTANFDLKKSSAFELMYLGWVSTSTFFEVIAVVYFYGARRLVINCLTMIKRTNRFAAFFKVYRFWMYFHWYIFQPIASFAICLKVIRYLYQAWTLHGLLYTTVAVFPFIYAVRRVVFAVLGDGPPHLLLKIHRRWGPAMAFHAKLAEHDEKAARI